ncbi:Response regulator PrrA [Tritonibacter multivorans]|uniref:Response regulator PrrA n=1 Tax=Tritonibacter multivorans TaxID=928856 RepID=A0A0N7LZL9_9RHOB|nr:response regulator [Tritonibacter multivorans]MDA7421720.1 response regulator [Tritonibacter multivorans]CUH78033.1 Response regulator PrrA [Tritonibacter multivorans]SFD03787.1 Response regulator receiver domain-containing protein [Tritonibacter multivorans]
MSSKADETPNQQLTVLLVDDDRDALEELKDIVDLEGWNAIIADSVDMALEVLEWYPFIGVVVTDVHFVDPSGDMSNGIQLVSRAQARFPGRDLNFVVLSGDPSALKSSVQIGAVDFLSKPLDADALIAAITAGAGEGMAYFEDPDRAENLLERVQSTTEGVHAANVKAAGDAA